MILLFSWVMNIILMTGRRLDSTQYEEASVPNAEAGKIDNSVSYKESLLQQIGLDFQPLFEVDDIEVPREDSTDEERSVYGDPGDEHAQHNVLRTVVSKNIIGGANLGAIR
ncbi:hypothetical protein SESBI_00985 [Sesbania bispinosa]|nr:hypothetical protein SESBI_00985 [Sesbania bispinosa]